MRLTAGAWKQKTSHFISLRAFVRGLMWLVRHSSCRDVKEYSVLGHFAHLRNKAHYPVGGGKPSKGINMLINFDLIFKALDAARNAVSWAIIERTISAFKAIEDGQMAGGATDGYNWSWVASYGHRGLTVDGSCGYGSSLIVENGTCCMGTCGGHWVKFSFETVSSLFWATDSNESLSSWADSWALEEDREHLRVLRLEGLDTEDAERMAWDRAMPHLPASCRQCRSIRHCHDCEDGV